MSRLIDPLLAAAAMTRGFSNATFKRSMGSFGGSTSCANLARSVQSSPPENRMATFASSSDERYISGMARSRISSERRSLCSKVATDGESGVNWGGCSVGGKALFIAGIGDI